VRKNWMTQFPRRQNLTFYNPFHIQSAGLCIDLHFRVTHRKLTNIYGLIYVIYIYIYSTGVQNDDIHTFFTHGCELCSFSSPGF
jgi:hypothetical protein